MSDVLQLPTEPEGTATPEVGHSRTVATLIGLAVFSMFVLFGVLATRCGSSGGRTVSANADNVVLAQVRNALASSGIPGLSAAPSAGGDVEVRGAVSSVGQRVSVLNLARQAAGPSVKVIDRLTVGDLEGRVRRRVDGAGLASIAVSTDSGNVVLQGIVASDVERTKAIALATDEAGNAKLVIDRLQIKSLSERVRAALDAAGFSGVRVVSSGNTEVSLTGSLGSAEQLRRALEVSRQAAGADRVVDQLTVATPATSTPASPSTTAAPATGPKLATATLSRATVTISGVVPDTATRDAIRAAAIAQFGAANVVDQMTIGTVAAADRRIVLAVDGALEDLALAAKLDAFGKAAAATTGYGVVADFTKAVDAKFNSLVNSQVLFDSGSAELAPAARAVLDQVASTLRGLPGRTLQVVGHTDDVGDDGLNLILSQERAGAVRTYLSAAGVEAGRVTAVGKGEAEPLRPNDSDENRRLNRRIEFKLS